MAGDATVESTESVAEQSRLWWFDGSLAALVVGSVAVVLVAGFLQVSFGVYSLPVTEVWTIVLDPDVLLDPQVWSAFLLGTELPQMSRGALVVWNIRLPRVLVGVMVGANLAVSGAIFQAVTRNELASPYVLGVNHGAGFAVLTIIVFFSGMTQVIPLAAAAGGVVAAVLVYVVAWRDGTTPVRLVLAGFVVGQVFWSLQQGMFFVIDRVGVVQSAIAWTTGSLTGTDWEQVRMALPWTVLSTTLALAGARQLNVLLLGEQTAESLGMSVERVRVALSAVAILAASVAISVAGIVGFVGLVVPHLVRLVVGSDYRRLLVGCLFAGPALVVAADVAARLALSPMQVPVGVVTGLLGGPYFLYLMRRQQRMGEF